MPALHKTLSSSSPSLFAIPEKLIVKAVHRTQTCSRAWQLIRFWFFGLKIVGCNITEVKSVGDFEHLLPFSKFELDDRSFGPPSGEELVQFWSNAGPIQVVLIDKWLAVSLGENRFYLSEIVKCWYGSTRCVAIGERGDLVPIKSIASGD